MNKMHRKLAANKRMDEAAENLLLLFCVGVHAYLLALLLGK